ncbi:MAG: SpaA isopeptide-forming pilin-related protein [Clostridiales Family XIII bacterium]|nr:SpaA isopeptide-forming pilin-related protein [Clostridiales Family XIII bacterium]
MRRVRAKDAGRIHANAGCNRQAILLMALIAVLLLPCMPQQASAFTINGGSYKALISYPGVKTFNYAVKPVRENLIAADMVDPEYSFKTGSKAVDEYFGSTATYTDRSGTKRKGFYLNKNSKGKCGVRYNKLFQYNNTWVDVKTTFTNWSLKDKKKAFAAGGFCKIWWTNVKWLKMKHEFFLSGTNTPVQVNGFFSFSDVDDAQGLAIPNGQIKKLWVNSKGTILKYKKEDDLLLIKSDDVLIPNLGTANYSPAKAATATFSYQFSGNSHTQYVLDGNADGSDNVIGFDAAKYIPSMIPQPKPPAIEKTVSDQDEKDVSNNIVPTIRDAWTYTLNGLVPLETEPGNFYQGFSMNDTLDSCLEIQDVHIYKNKSEDVSGQFTINISGPTVSAAAKNCSTASFYGCNYQLRITAGIKSGATEEILRNHGHYDSGRGALRFSNTGRVVYQAGGSQTVRTTNTVTTEIPLPVLSITKETSKKEYRVGDPIDYTVRVTQTKANSAALDLYIKDDSLPKEVKVLADTLQVSGITGYELTPLENGCLLKVKRLNYGQTAVIRYQARAEKAAAHRDIDNTALTGALLAREKTATAAVHIKPYNIEGQKIWDDHEDQDGLRPQSLKVKLMADGQMADALSISEETEWKYVFEDLEPFDEQGRRIDYTVEEEQIPGYTSKQLGYDMVNHHTPEQITIEGAKLWNDADDLDKLRPKRVIVYLMADGKKYASKTISAAEDWKYSWTVDKYRPRGVPIDYKVEEKPVDGYEASVSNYDLVNTHVPYQIHLVKYEKLENGEKTEKPLAGAVYLAYRQGEKDENGNLLPDKFLGRYTTDSSGSIIIRGLSPGSYYLLEDRAPPGYRKEKDRIDIQMEKAQTDGPVKQPQITTVIAYNQREYGLLELVKKDDRANSVADAVFGLYRDQDCQRQEGSYTTDDKGRIRIDSLRWGIYFLKELQAPGGYERSEEIQKVEIGPENLHPVIEVYNQQKKGSVVLTKTDETETIRLVGAVYDLFDDAGRIVKENLTTDEKGRLQVEGLRWGGYYFLEKKAPEGYGISSEKIRFSVNSTTGGMTQYVEAADKARRGQLTIVKQLRADEIHMAHGVPSFIFRLTGKTADGEAITEYQMATFNQTYVENNRDQDGTVKKSVVFSGLKSGTYQVEELEHIRYQLAGITDLSPNGKRDGDKVIFQLEGEEESTATFLNEKEKWQDYSHTAAKTNLIKLNRRLTGLKLQYEGENILEGNQQFPREKLQVTAVYDDGTQAPLGQNQFQLKKEDGGVLTRVPKIAGSYTAAVEYEEDGICRRATITYQVEAVKLLTIQFDTGGGGTMAPLIAEKYSCLADYKEGEYIPLRSGFSFGGWYLDKELISAFDTKKELVEDLTLYARWQEKHLNDYTWEEIKKIADSGKAETVLDECFSAVKKDLEDGRLSQETLKHTKELTINGKQCHAVILGFNQDRKEDGSRAGLSFLIWEPVAADVFNPTLTNQGGWKDSQLRKKTAPLAAELPQAAVPVQKESWGFADGKALKETTWDKLWLLSQSEVCGAWGYEDEELEPSIYFEDLDFGRLRSGRGEGAQYKLFQGLIPDGKPDLEAAAALGKPWWLRSANLEGEQRFCFFDADGAAR